ncbi:MAG: group II intron reverse transcriptase/maturase [Planctomycetes bacterium]|nr:group II intron reverse transcriptase/maturase [Planctomycetota bacterium]
MRKQMTVVKTGALIDKTTWRSIDWKKARFEVQRLQMRIAKAVQEGKHGKVKSLQWLLTHSFYAKAMAVKRVTSNKGKKTPGTDGILWKGSCTKMQVVLSLHQHGYKAQPLRRIYIPKKNGRKRPLSIPTMYDRAMQALYKLALAPVAETTADRNSYGFREGRSCADAVSAAFNALAKPNSATWVLEGDIASCYDNISHLWLRVNIPLEKRMLNQWLCAGYVEKGISFPTRKGTPQGGIISPTLSNMTLDGLEQAVISATPRRTRINFIRYADDFIITGKSKSLLENDILPTVEKFLSERGLCLSPEKTKITYIKDGFEFLSQHFRKYGRILRITPSKESVHSLIMRLGTIIRKYVSSPMGKLIKKLNSMLRGWANYHRHVVSSEVFARVDTYVYEQLWRMLHRRHSNKSKGWLIKKYWTATGKKWIFSVKSKYKGKTYISKVLRICSIGIKRHIKIKADANPYLRKYRRYYWERKHKKEAKVMSHLSAREVRRARG